MTATEQHKSVIDDLVAHLNTAYGVPESELREAFATVIVWTWIAVQDASQERFEETRERIRHG